LLNFAYETVKKDPKRSMDEIPQEQLNNSLITSYGEKNTMPVSPKIQMYQQMLDDLRNEIEENAQHQINDYYCLLQEIQSPKSVHNVEEIIHVPSTRRKFLIKKKNWSISVTELENLSDKTVEDPLHLDMDVILNGKNKREDRVADFFVTTLNSPLQSSMKFVVDEIPALTTSNKTAMSESSTSTKATTNSPDSPPSSEEMSPSSFVPQRLFVDSPSQNKRAATASHRNTDSSSRLWIDFPNRTKSPWVPNNANHSSGSRNVITRYSLQQRNRFIVSKKQKSFVNFDESILTPRRKAPLDTGAYLRSKSPKLEDVHVSAYSKEPFRDVVVGDHDKSYERLVNNRVL
jgi:hypothetical protein